jgi:GNAT superfamily N-acetyltransferase
VTDTTWKRFFDHKEPVYALVAEKNSQILGFATYLFHRSTSMIEMNCYLQDLFTSPSARGQGIGEALINAVYDYARKSGSTRTYWLTHETNETAIGLYNKVADRSGFIVFRKER